MLILAKDQHTRTKTSFDMLSKTKNRLERAQVSMQKAREQEAEAKAAHQSAVTFMAEIEAEAEASAFDEAEQGDDFPAMDPLGHGPGSSFAGGGGSALATSGDARPAGAKGPVQGQAKAKGNVSFAAALMADPRLEALEVTQQ